MSTSPIDSAGASTPTAAPAKPPASSPPAVASSPATAPTGDAGATPPPPATAASSPSTTPYPEPDKLGPLPAASTTPVPGGEVRGRVLAELADAVAAARAGAAQAPADPVEAVHEVRKALRRMRAIVDAVRPAIDRKAHRSVRDALVEARRALGPSRDRTVAHGALAAVPDELAAHAAAIVAASNQDAPAVDDEREALAHAIAEADAQAVALAAALPEDLRAGKLARGLARTFARARDARRKVKKSDRAIHRWRRRQKELVYQLPLVPGDVAAELRRALVEVDDTLGHAVDRLLLTDFVGHHGEVLDESAADALLAHVHGEMITGRDQARGASKPVYATRPRKLRKQLRRALRGSSTPEAAASADPTPAADPASP